MDVYVSCVYESTDYIGLDSIFSLQRLIISLLPLRKSATLPVYHPESRPSSCHFPFQKMFRASCVLLGLSSAVL